MTLTDNEIIELVAKYYAEETEGDFLFLDEGFTARKIALDLWNEGAEHHIDAAHIQGTPPANPEEIAHAVARALACVYHLKGA